ncbi:MAG: AAA family ATPase, partial [Candidatus Sericytochromatia bacterium]
KIPLSEIISFGASPRASIYLTKASKAMAFINGRGYVTPSDIRHIVHDILRHRIILSYEAEAETITQENVISKILEYIPVP